MQTIQATGYDLKVSVNGETVCYDDLGDGSIPIIFLHGFPFNKSSWQPQMEYFKDTCRVLAYDIRGFGDSTSGQGTKTMSLFAEDLIAFMDALEIDRAIVCGLSMGGFILLNAAHRFPERFKALVFCDTQCIADSSEIKAKRSETIVKINTSGTKDFADDFIEKVFCKESLSSKKILVERVRSIILSTSPKTITEGLHALAERWEMCRSLDEISSPALILCGTEDTVTLPLESEFMYRNIANSRLHFIERAGHLSNLEQPEEFNMHLADFISDLTKQESIYPSA